MICRHCKARAVSRPRGLCWSCFYNPQVRGRYPAKTKNTPEEVCGRPVLPPPWPTKANPGTAEKIHVLRKRAAARQQLWHPGDA